MRKYFESLLVKIIFEISFWKSMWFWLC